MGNARLWNPWLKPANEGYIKPSDIERLNSKIDKQAVERRKRLTEIQQARAEKEAHWDALEAALSPRGACYD
ncbi:MAG: hypothetical protein AB7D03_03695 [Thiomicrospira sp.]